MGLGMLNEAEAEFKEAIALDPSHQGLLTHLQQFHKRTGEI
jgi:hypothetical protein